MTEPARRTDGDDWGANPFSNILGDIEQPPSDDNAPPPPPDTAPQQFALVCISTDARRAFAVINGRILQAGEGSSRTIEPPGLPEVEIEPADPAVETAGPAASNDVESAPPEDPVAFQAFPLMFLEASHAVTLIEPLLTPGVGMVKGVDEGNLLVVRDRAATLAQVAEVISRLDGESRQIRISVKIVIINRTDIDSAGFDWMTRFRASGAAKPITYPFNKRHQAGSFFPENDPFGEDEESGADFPLNGSFPYAEKGDFAFGTLSATEFSLLIEFLSTTSDTELVSEPEITTVNNKTAKIINGNIVQVPIYSQNLQYGITSVTGYQEIETGSASPPRIVGSPEFHARVAATWRARGGLCRTIETNGAEVACRPPERIAYELLHFASRLYQQTILASTLPHELEASRDGFWAVLTLNRAPYPSEAYLAWFYRSLLLLKVPPSVEGWRNTLEPRHTELHIEAEKNAIMPAWTGLEIQP